MAVGDITSSSQQSNGNIHSQNQAANSHLSFLDIQDQIDSNFNAAIAIIDCVSILSALERVEPQRESNLALGQGFADGYQTMDDSMPMALYHATRILKETRSLIEQIQCVSGTKGGAA